MQKKRDKDQLKEAYKVAIEHFLLKENNSPPIKLRDVATRMKISRPKTTELLRIAWEAGMIEVTLRPVDEINPDLANMMKMEKSLLQKLQRFSPPHYGTTNTRKHKLINVFITPNAYGLIKTHKEFNTTQFSHFESVASRVAHKAAIELKKIFSEYSQARGENEKETLYIGIGAGRTCERLLNRLPLIQPPHSNAKVCPMVGLTNIDQTSIEANFLAFRLGLKLSGKSIKLPCPMIVPDYIKTKEISQVKTALSNIRKCIIGVSAIGIGCYSKNKQEILSEWVEAEIITEDQKKLLRDIGVKAEINGNFIDINGDPISLKQIGLEQIGIDFDTMRKMDRYMVIVSPNSCKALPAVLAVKSGICSDLVLDHQTASRILDTDNYRDLEIK